MSQLCRHIQLLYINETSTLICKDFDAICSEISSLEGFDVVINSANTNLENCTYHMNLTMLDGKAVNSLTIVQYLV